jgi:formylglycine-generating enzyme required for sulfatase activity
MRAAMFLALAACGYPQPQRLNTGDGGHDAPKKDAAPDSPPALQSCASISATCGPSGSANCCATGAVAGGTFDRGYDVAGDSLSGTTANPATVSAYKLDTYDVTVARFRAFVNAQQGTQEHPPGAGTGAHAAIANSGWDANWDGNLTANAAALTTALACAGASTWSDTPGANESLPINCVSWYEAMAFCIWDGGYLPTEAEWNFAASGGSDQRAYPWSSPAASLTTDCTHANYTDTGCAPVSPVRVGNHSPAGDGKFGQTDLAGNVWQWVLDADGAYPVPCTDCANLSGTTMRVIRGGNFEADPDQIRVTDRNKLSSSSHFYIVGFRCARPM